MARNAQHRRIAQRCEHPVGRVRRTQVVGLDPAERRAPLVDPQPAGQVGGVQTHEVVHAVPGVLTAVFLHEVRLRELPQQAPHLRCRDRREAGDGGQAELGAWCQAEEREQACGRRGQHADRAGQYRTQVHRKFSGVERIEPGRGSAQLGGERGKGQVGAERRPSGGDARASGRPGAVPQHGPDRAGLALDAVRAELGHEHLARFVAVQDVQA